MKLLSKLFGIALAVTLITPLATRSMEGDGDERLSKKPRTEEPESVEETLTTLEIDAPERSSQGNITPKQFSDAIAAAAVSLSGPRANTTESSFTPEQQRAINEFIRLLANADQLRAIDSFVRTMPSEHSE